MSDDERQRQTEERQRQVRKQYRDLKEDLLEGNVQPGEILEQANEYLQNVEYPQEAVLDSTIFGICVRKYKEDADEKRGKHGMFNTEEFASFVKNRFYGNQDVSTSEDWKNLGRYVQHAVKRPVPLNYVYGAFEKKSEEEAPTTTKKTKRTPARGNAIATSTRFTLRTAEDAKKEGPKQASFDDLVKDVENCLRSICRKKDSLELFDFVIHPDSFSETVRHLFLTSFLVKDKRAFIFMVDGFPYISSKYGDKSDGTRVGDKSGQMIQSITKSQWESLVGLLGNEEPKIKFRKGKST